MLKSKLQDYVMLDGKEGQTAPMSLDELKQQVGGRPGEAEGVLGCRLMQFALKAAAADCLFVAMHSIACVSLTRHPCAWSQLAAFTSLTGCPDSRQDEGQACAAGSGGEGGTQGSRRG